MSERTKRLSIPEAIASVLSDTVSDATRKHFPVDILAALRLEGYSVHDDWNGEDRILNRKKRKGHALHDTKAG